MDKETFLRLFYAEVKTTNVVDDYMYSRSIFLSVWKGIERYLGSGLHNKGITALLTP